MTNHIPSGEDSASLKAAPRPLTDFGRADDAVTIPYRANLLGNIEQALKGLQGYGIMALELIQNADDAGAKSLSFDVADEALIVDNDGEFSTCGLHEPVKRRSKGTPDRRRRGTPFSDNMMLVC